MTLPLILCLCKGRGGQWSVYYSCPQSLIIPFFIYWLHWILIDWIIKLSFQTCQPLISIYRRGNFYIIIRDEHQFIGHCLFSLDLYIFRLDCTDASLIPLSLIVWMCTPCHKMVAFPHLPSLPQPKPNKMILSLTLFILQKD